MDKEIYKIPKDKEAANLTLEECLAIIKLIKHREKKEKVSLQGKNPEHKLYCMEIKQYLTPG